MEIEKKLANMGLELPPIPTPVANYVSAVQVGSLLFLSGHAPGLLKDGKVQFIQGKVGKDLTTEEGYEAAKQVTLNLLQSIKKTIGDLDKVKRVVKLLGFVNCTEDLVVSHFEIFSPGRQLPRLIVSSRCRLPIFFGDRVILLLFPPIWEGQERQNCV